MSTFELVSMVFYSIIAKKVVNGTLTTGLGTPIKPEVVAFYKGNTYQSLLDASYRFLTEEERNLLDTQVLAFISSMA